MAQQVRKTPKRVMVKQPLTPSMLSDMGALDKTPLPAGAFDPAGDWRHTYRIWTCYGYRNQANKDQGTLTIARSSGPGDSVDLNIEQTLRMDPKKARRDHVISAEIRCRSDALATPTAWTLTSRFTGGAEGEQSSDMDHAEEVELSGDRLEVRIGDRLVERQVSDRFTADWCLFEALGRLPPGADALEFDLLEGLTVWKPGQRLSYRGKLRVEWGDRSVDLHCFQQLGRGVWPYEFWLDDEHRLVMVITGVRVYILEPEREGAQ